MEKVKNIALVAHDKMKKEREKSIEWREKPGLLWWQARCVFLLFRRLFVCSELPEFLLQIKFFCGDDLFQRLDPLL